MALFLNGKQVRGSLIVEGDLTMPLPTIDTASGSVATFDTDLTENLIEVKCQIVAQQSGSGTPSPDNERPIIVYNSLTLGQDANYDKFLDFNQLIQNGNFTSTSNWSAARGSISANNNECAYTLSEITTVSTGNRIQQLIAQLKSHKYIAMIKVKVPHASTVGIECYNAGLITGKSVSDIDTYVDCDVLFSANATSSAFFYWGISDSTGSGYVIGDTVYFKDAQLIDLTQMFGETLADEIYNMEQQTTGSGVAYVKNLLYKDYYDYNTGTIETLGTINNDGTGHTYNIPFGQTVANGVLDVTTGKLTVTHFVGYLTGSCIEVSWYNADIDRNSIGFYIYPTPYVNNTGYPFPIEAGGVFDYCQTGNVYNNDNAWTANFLFVGGEPNRFEIRLPKSVLSDISSSTNAINSAKDYLNNNPLQTMYKIIPYEIQLDSITLQALLNENNIWCDTNGDTSVKYLLSVGKKIS